MLNTTLSIIVLLLVLSQNSCSHKNPKLEEFTYDPLGVEFVQGVPDKASHDPSSPFQYLQSHGKLERFEIATWNIENFPRADILSTVHAGEIIDRLDVDIIGVQEISSIPDFRKLVKEADGYDGVISKHRYNSDRAQKPGFIYKRSEMKLLEAKQIFRNNRFAFPRPPLFARFERINKIDGLPQTFTAISVHLKAMGDEKKSEASKDSKQST